MPPVQKLVAYSIVTSPGAAAALEANQDMLKVSYILLHGNIGRHISAFCCVFHIRTNCGVCAYTGEGDLVEVNKE